jgi:hypothetical protein
VTNGARVWKTEGLAPSPALVLVLIYAAFIVLGAVALKLPVSTTAPIT